MAPIAPFLAEDIHQEILRPLGESLESVHMASWPIVDRTALDVDLEERMSIALKVAEYANAQRNRERVKLRWPLRALIVGGDDKVKAAVVTFADSIKRLTNIKDITYGHAPKWQFESEEGVKIFLDTEMDAELKKEAAIREIVRKIQDLRKAAKMVVTDKITAHVSGADLTGFEDDIKSEVGATKLVIGDVKVRRKDKVEFEGQQIEVGIEPK